MIDSDMGFSPDLTAAMLALDKPVVGTLYPRRLVDLRKLHSLSKLPSTRPSQSLELLGTIIEPRQEMGGFVRVLLCGTGIFLVSGDCVTRIVDKLPETVNRSRYRINKYAAQFESFLTPFSKIVTPDVDLPTPSSCRPAAFRTSILDQQCRDIRRRHTKHASRDARQPRASVLCSQSAPLWGCRYGSLLS